MSDDTNTSAITAPTLTVDEMRDQLQRATDFFDSMGTGPLDATEAASPDSDGLINFIAIEETLPSALQKTAEEVRVDLLTLTGIGTAFVRRKATQEKNPDLVFDPMEWEEIFLNFPLLSDPTLEQKSFNQKIKGVEIATKFLETIAQATVSGGAALKSFREFLAQQGSTVRAGIQGNKDGYRFASITSVITVVRSGGQMILVPTLRGFFLTFAREDLQFTAGCASGRSFAIDFKFRTLSAVFNYRLAQSDKEEGKLFNAFLRGRVKEDITRSRNFFDGEDFNLTNKK
jgi:hypothetical protein